MNLSCPYCLTGSITDSVCKDCGKKIRLVEGIPSTTRQITIDPNEEKLQILTTTEKSTLDKDLARARDDYMDGLVIDRFFKTRTVNWRVFVAQHLSGRGLVLGDHDEKVGILLSEVLEEVFTVDTSPTRLRAQTAVAEASERKVNPLHSEVDSLPFPENSFDVIVIQCRAWKVSESLSRVTEFLAEDGVLFLLVDGWTRELGLADLAGLGDTPNGMSDRFLSTLIGHSIGIKNRIQSTNLSVTEQYALLSTNRHENERTFDVCSQAALDWLLDSSPKTATSVKFQIARVFSRIARKTKVIQQCYPRYLFVCQPTVGTKTPVKESTSQESILIAGKNRSTILEFSENEIHRIRKVPNSRRQGNLNKSSFTATEAATGAVAEAIPESELIDTPLGPERREQPVTGTPLDQTLQTTPESVDMHLKIVFKWLSQFQLTNTVKWVKKDPDTVEEELRIDRLKLLSPPDVDRSIKIPQVITHGDLFGSNIYLEEERVTNIIDWEWAEIGANPVVDSGFFLLQLAEYLGKDFEHGFEQLFFEDKRYRELVYAQINDYCKKIGIEPRTFVTFLPISYIQRARKDLEFNKRLDVNWPTRIQKIWESNRRLSRNI